MKLKVIKTERGWGGHFCCADRCLFRRNTLLTLNDIRIVVSTVGLMQNLKKSYEFMMIGHDRYYETMAFHATLVDNRYWDADVNKEVEFDGPWTINEVDADDKANDQHEKIVKKIKKAMLLGKYNGTF